MPYVLRRDNLNKNVKGKFEFVTEYQDMQAVVAANRADKVEGLLTMASMNEVHKHPRWLILGFYPVYINSRKVPGLMPLAQKYNGKLRTLRAAAALLSSIYEQEGYHHTATAIMNVYKAIAYDRKAIYERAKKELIENAKSRQ